MVHQQVQHKLLHYMPVLLRPSVKTEALAATNFEGFVYYCPKRKTNCVVFKGKSE